MFVIAIGLRSLGVGLLFFFTIALFDCVCAVNIFRSGQSTSGDEACFYLLFNVEIVCVCKYEKGFFFLNFLSQFFFRSELQ